MRLRQPIYLWVVIVMVAAAAARVTGWSNWSFWLDESMQVDYVRHGFAEMWKVVAFDGAHPPLDYILLWLWYRVSPAEAWLRTLPVLWSCAAVLAVFLRSGGSRAPVRSVAAASAFAAFPLAVYLGQELRPYAAALCFVAAFDAARARHFENGGRFWLVAAGCLGVLASWTLYWAGLYVAFSWLLDLLRFARRRDRSAFVRAGLAATVSVLLFVPWLVVVASFKRPGQASSAPHASATLVLRFAGGLAADRQEDVKQPTVAVIVWALVVLGLVAGPRTERLRAAVELTVFSAGVLVALSAAGHWWALRYMAIALLPLSRAVGYGVDRLGTWLKAGPGAAVIATAALFLLQSAGIRDSSRWARPDWRRPANYLAFMADSGEGGPVAAADPWAYFTLRTQLRLDPRATDVALKAEEGDLDAWIRGTERGWIVRAPHFGAPSAVDRLLSAEPWARFARAEDARLYRVASGRLVSP